MHHSLTKKKKKLSLNWHIFFVLEVDRSYLKVFSTTHSQSLSIVYLAILILNVICSKFRTKSSKEEKSYKWGYKCVCEKQRYKCGFFFFLFVYLLNIILFELLIWLGWDGNVEQRSRGVAMTPTAPPVQMGMTRWTVEDLNWSEDTSMIHMRYVTYMSTIYLW